MGWVMDGRGTLHHRVIMIEDQATVLQHGNLIILNYPTIEQSRAFR